MSRTVAHSFVPYITARHGEEAALASTLCARPGPRGGLFYTDEGPGDRDARGVLWARCSQNRDGNAVLGKPRWKDVHPARQRECMEQLLCQGCVQQASRTSLGYLFLASSPSDATSTEWVEGYRTAQPPLCLQHAAIATERCGHLLREGVVALRARVPRLYGVLGTYYQSRGFQPPEPIETEEEEDDVPLSYRDRRYTPWILASQLVRELRGVTVIDLAEEIEAGV
ncbi:hypothetical protein [Streptomyces sp. NPDC058677]|uniref:hypothetical protein n=1 Tax=Streptomyces sp. NPDC058677 TaxID=3346594 RepID=UPI0036481E51